MVIFFAGRAERCLERNGGPRSTLGGSIVTDCSRLGHGMGGARAILDGIRSVGMARPKDRAELALTFDDGPTPSTPDLLRALEDFRIPATFFQCGMHVRRFPSIAREIVSAGHEVANHTDSHARLWLRSSKFVYDELERAQNSIAEITGRLRLGSVLRTVSAGLV